MYQRATLDTDSAAVYQIPISEDEDLTWPTEGAQAVIHGHAATFTTPIEGRQHRIDRLTRCAVNEDDRRKVVTVTGTSDYLTRIVGIPEAEATVTITISKWATCQNC